MTTKAQRVLPSRCAEVVLWSVGLVCAAMTVQMLVRALEAQHRAALFIAGVVAGQQLQVTGFSPQNSQATSATTVIGRLELPQLGLVVPILSDFDTESLRQGVGHVQGTAYPGGLGTVGLVGQRDTYFRPLRRIAIGMDIQLTDAHGTFHYEVDSTEIVLPEQVQVLDIRDRPELTLVTCYPFDFVGAAPKRFIVHAHLLSLTPDSSAGKH